MFNNEFFKYYREAILIALTILVPIFGLIYFSGFQEAKVYNQINTTRWTAWDFIWAGDQINSQSQTIKLIK